MKIIFGKFSKTYPTILPLETFNLREEISTGLTFSSSSLAVFNILSKKAPALGIRILRLVGGGDGGSSYT